MRHIKISIILFLILSFNIDCKGNLLSNIAFSEYSEPIAKIVENKINSNTYFFNKVFTMKLFELNFKKSSIETELKSKKIQLDKNTLNFSDCSIEVRIKKDKSVNYFNGKQNVKIYNDIISESGFKIDDEINFLVPLYEDNKCKLPSDNFIFLNDKDIIFVYKGYLVLFSKSIKSKQSISKLSKIKCGEEKGSLEAGFSTVCTINENLQNSYEIFMAESKINEIKYLKSILPTTDTKYKIKESEVVYKFKKNNCNITLLFPGGESIIDFTYNKNRTEIVIKNFPD